ncbi:MAG: DUF1015 domain-containing protein [Nitrospirota bacterium]
MADIAPFRGVVFRPAGKALGRRMAPPYDIISPALQRDLYRRDQYNIVRLEFGKVSPRDNEKNNRYSRAARDLARWLRAGILGRDEAPALYPYAIDYKAGRTKKVLRGFLCALGAEPYETGAVLPHERTLSKPKTDRLSLLRACRANFSPIFGLYDDPRRKISRAMASAYRKKPFLRVADDNGAVHALWRLTDPKTIQSVQRELSRRPVFIADGHHRYETSLAHREECRAAGSVPGDRPAPCDRIMIYLAGMEDPGLTILPTHREIRNLPHFDPARILEALSASFRAESVSAPRDKLARKLVDKMEEAGGRGPAFGLVLSGAPMGFLLTPRPAALKSLPRGLPAPVRRLDVTILHNLAFERGLGISTEDLARQTYVTYTKSADEAVANALSGSAQMVFLLNPPKVRDVRDVARDRAVMPQKSTYFYPKILTGPVLNVFEGAGGR